MSQNKFNFQNLIVLDLANNHQGSLDHGKKIISSLSKVVKKNKERAAIKFQFRNLPEFVHVDDRDSVANKHIPRFLSTMLDWNEFEKLKEYAKKQEMLTMCTPFDEYSVDKIKEMNFDLIKVASCSAKDWPLLKKIADSNLPIIASTGGLSLSEVDDLVSFFKHRGCDFALMHCVAVYPTPDKFCNLGNISDFKKRYKDLVIGWSTHEPPEESLHAGLALALGAEIFERHVGLEYQGNELNKYSSNPDQIDEWLKSLNKSKNLIGSFSRLDSPKEEFLSLNSLKRGVFAQKKISKGDKIDNDNTYFAFPYREGQMSSGDFKLGATAKKSIEINEPLFSKDVIFEEDNEEKILKKSIHEVKAMLSYAGITLNNDFSTEYSHHYGISNFREVGAILINVINREYCKKILVQLPGQSHPSHFHKVKEETFIIVWGELISTLEGRERVLLPGDTLLVPPGAWHSFRSEKGCIFEEISTTAIPGDSVYRDENINNLSSSERKTIVDYWGRFQINEQLRNSKLPLNVRKFKSKKTTKIK